MIKLPNDFVSNDKKNFKWKIGRIMASSLSGFIAGIIVTILFFLAVFDIALK